MGTSRETVRIDFEGNAPEKLGAAADASEKYSESLDEMAGATEEAEAAQKSLTEKTAEWILIMSAAAATVGSFALQLFESVEANEKWSDSASRVRDSAEGVGDAVVIAGKRLLGMDTTSDNMNDTLDRTAEVLDFVALKLKDVNELADLTGPLFEGVELGALRVAAVFDDDAATEYAAKLEEVRQNLSDTKTEFEDFVALGNAPLTSGLEDFDAIMANVRKDFERFERERDKARAAAARAANERKQREEQLRRENELLEANIEARERELAAQSAAEQSELRRNQVAEKRLQALLAEENPALADKLELEAKLLEIEGQSIPINEKRLAQARARIELEEKAKARAQAKADQDKKTSDETAAAEQKRFGAITSTARAAGGLIAEVTGFKQIQAGIDAIISAGDAARAAANLDPFGTAQHLLAAASYAAAAGTSPPAAGGAGGGGGGGAGALATKEAEQRRLDEDRRREELTARRDSRLATAIAPGGGEGPLIVQFSSTIPPSEEQLREFGTMLQTERGTRG